MATVGDGHDRRCDCDLGSAAFCCRAQTRGTRSRLRREQLRHQFVNSPLTTTPVRRLPAPAGCRKSEEQRCRIWLSQEFRRSRFKTVVHASIATRDIAGSTGHSLRGRCGINPIDRHVRSRADAATTLASRGKIALNATNRPKPRREEIIPLYRSGLVSRQATSVARLEDRGERWHERSCACRRRYGNRGVNGADLVTLAAIRAGD
jgi:hypothetical protein